MLHHLYPFCVPVFEKVFLCCSGWSQTPEHKWLSLLSSAITGWYHHAWRICNFPTPLVLSIQHSPQLPFIYNYSPSIFVLNLVQNPKLLKLFISEFMPISSLLFIQVKHTNNLSVGCYYPGINAVLIFSTICEGISFLNGSIRRH